MAEHHFVCDTTGCNECIYWDKFIGCCSYHLITGKWKGWQRGPTCKVRKVQKPCKLYSGIVRINKAAFSELLKSNGISYRAASLKAGRSEDYIHHCMRSGKINKVCLDIIARTYGIDTNPIIENGECDG